MKRILALIVLGMLASPAMRAAEDEIDWRKVKVDCTRRKSKSQGEIGNNRGEERREHVTITCTIKNDNKVAISGIALHAYIINETVSDNRRKRKIVQGEDKLTKDITVDSREKKTVELIKSTVVEKAEWDNYWQNGQVESRTRESGEKYEGYLVLLKDSNDKILVVKAENSKIRKYAYELKILPKDLKIDRSGLVITKK